MDPLSAIASIWTIAGSIKELTSIARKIYHAKDASTETAQAQKLLQMIRTELQRLRQLRILLNTTVDTPIHISLSPLSDAVATAEELLASIEKAFPAGEEDPKSWRKKLRWALKDKEVVAKLLARMKDTESTLMTILQIENIRIGQLMWTTLAQQSATLARIEMQQSLLHQQRWQTLSFTEIHASSETSNSNNWAVDRFEQKTYTNTGTWLDRVGFRTSFVQTYGSDGLVYHAVFRIRIPGGNKFVTAHFRVRWFDFSFVSEVRYHNIIPYDSEVVMACRTGNVNQVKNLFLNNLAHPTDVIDKRGETIITLLDEAVSCEQPVVISLLLSYGAEPNTAATNDQRSPLHTAFSFNRSDLARLLLLHGADLEHVSTNNMTVVSYLAMYSDTHETSELLDICSAQGFTGIHTRDLEGRSALHFAAERGSVPFVQALLRLGASITIRDQQGLTPLWYSVRADNIGVFEELLRLSPEPTWLELSPQGWNLLHEAAYWGAERIMHYLLKRGLSPYDVTQPPASRRMKKGLHNSVLHSRPFTARDIALYAGQDPYTSYIAALEATGHSALVEIYPDIFYDAEEIILPGIPSAFIQCIRHDDVIPLQTLLRKSMEDVSVFESDIMLYPDGKFPLYYGWDLYHVATYYGSTACLRFLLNFWGHELCPSKTSWIARMKVGLREVALARSYVHYRKFLNVVKGLECEACQGLVDMWEKEDVFWDCE